MKGHGTKLDSHGAILVVAMGTTQIEGRNVVKKFVESAKKKYPHAEVDFAFNSETVRLVLKENGEEVLGPLAAMTRLLDKGHSQVVVQPLYITPGLGYHELYNLISSLNELAGAHGSGHFAGILISRPLLMNSEDYTEISKVLYSSYGKDLAKDEASVLVVPSIEGGSDPSLCQLQMVIDDICESGQVVVGAVGGYPDVEKVCNRLSHLGSKNVKLVLLSLVPGIHSWLELSGDGNKDSWKSCLEVKGFNVTVDEKAVGELDEITDLFIKRLEDTAQSHKFLK